MTVILFMQQLLKGIFVFTLNLLWLEFCFTVLSETISFLTWVFLIFFFFLKKDWSYTYVYNIINKHGLQSSWTIYFSLTFLLIFLKSINLNYLYSTKYVSKLFFFLIKNRMKNSKVSQSVRLGAEVRKLCRYSVNVKFDIRHLQIC